jgi:hypothetical protein
MRHVLVALALAIAPHAAAQERANIAGFYIGMSDADARAMAPDAFGSHTENRARFNARHTVNLGGVELPLSLIFVSGALDYAGGGVFTTQPSSEACLTQLEQLAGALETTAGPLRDSELARPPSDRVRVLEPLRTAAGSYIHRYASGPGVGGEATANAPLAVEARAWAQPLGAQWQCMLTYGISASNPPPPDLPQSTIQNWEWIARPTGNDYARYYPMPAMNVERPGNVILICMVIADGAVSCRVGYENPVGWGFGESALRIARHFRIAPQTADGVPTAGATLRVPIRFQAGF